MAGKKKETVTGTEIEYGKTGYGVNLSEEGKDPIDGNFITDEDLKEYQELKAAKQTGQFITNDDAAHYQQLKETANNETGKQEADQAAAIANEEANRQAQLKQYGDNPVHAVNLDGDRTMVWPRAAWDNLAYEMKDGKETKVKTGGWMVKTETPDEIKKLRSEQSVATQ